MPAGATLRIGLVARDGLREVDAETQPFAHDARLAPPDQGRVDLQRPALHRGARGQVREPFERGDEFRAAIRIARIIDRVDAEHHVVSCEHLGPGERRPQHHGVARRHVGDRNPRARCPRAPRSADRSAPNRRVCPDPRARRGFARAERARQRAPPRPARRNGAARRTPTARSSRSRARAPRPARSPSPVRPTAAPRRAQRPRASPHRSLCSCT